MQQATVVTIVKRNDLGRAEKILLVLKKRGFAKGKWNGPGGKIHPGETIRQCAIRETEEEIGIKLTSPRKIGMVKFRFKFPPKFDQNVHFYFCDKWEGKPVESEEVEPQWFTLDKIPYSRMWPDDELWLPLALAGKKFTGSILFGKNDKILKNSIKKVRVRQGGRAHALYRPM